MYKRKKHILQKLFFQDEETKKIFMQYIKNLKKFEDYYNVFIHLPNEEKQIHRAIIEHLLESICDKR